MKVVFIVTCLTQGGAQMALLRLLSTLNKAIQVHVISLQDVEEVGRDIAMIGVPVEGLGMKPGMPNPWMLVRLAMRLRALQPDLVQTWMYHADLLGGVACQLGCMGVPIVWCVHHSNLSSTVNKRTTLFVVKFCAWVSRIVPAKIIFCAEEAQRVHLSIGYSAPRSLVIPHGLNLSQYLPDPDARVALRRTLGLEGHARLVGMLGRFHPIKNHRGFIQMAARLLKARPDCHFVLAGPGVDRNNRELCAWIEEASLGSNVHVLGEVDNVPALLAALDVFVLTSWGEALPTVVAEAMSCGVPCVVSDVGDAALMVEGTGTVVQAGDDAGFARACDQLLSLSAEERRDLGVRARQHVTTHYEVGTMARRYEVLYDELTRQRRQ